LQDWEISAADFFFAVPVADLPLGTAAAVDFYVCIRDDHSVYLTAGQDLNDSIRLALDRSGIESLYVQSSHAGPYARGAFEAARLLLNSANAPVADRAQAIRTSAGAAALHLVHNPGIQSFQMACDITELTVAEALESPESLTALVKMTYVDQDLHYHLVNSSIYAIALAGPLGISAADRLVTIGLAGLLYDLGMARISRRSSTGDPDLDPVVRQHVFIGRDLVQSVPGISREVRDAAVSHHERWDGGGYPAGLQSTRIPLSGRICAVVDTFDALTTTVSGGTPLGALQALRAMSRDMPGRFDPALLRALVVGLSA
jgi:HD-GYP domain-containing protein (c-di-GMP phosphodiesterase class II)